VSIESIAIVGASLAGARAAQALRKRGFDGKISLIGNEKHAPYDRPPLSKDVLAGKVAFGDTFLASESEWAADEIDLVLDQAVIALRPTQAEVELADGRMIAADKVLLCTGGQPRTLNVAGEALDGVYCLRTIDDSRRISDRLLPGARVVVVGAGFIGAEVASCAQMLGCEVTLVEIAQVPLWRVLGENMGRFYGQVHRDHGVRLLTGIGVDDIIGDTAVRQVVLSDGSSIPADVVVVGVGIVASTELALTAGAEVNNGIVVNEFCETTVPGIYAAGDVANHPNAIIGERVRLEHWQNAQNQAAAAASSMLGERKAFCEVPWFWSDQYQMNLQVAGHPHASDQVVCRGSMSESGFSAFYLRNGVLRAVLGVNRAKEVRAGLDLIGASAVLSAEVIKDESTDLRKLARAAKQAATEARGAAQA
jgi:3-phenylpropionate/trans-cinnamate dioxygenase ferredoxin reductase subunit